ncbi:MAG: NupC/NupG family nucleoside CNT transporter [Proteobacteria bacterium]|jgi:CNT family concentrative nucleoside transporter|nr:NupC/NupG family nucleoside CNT transporter [Pseudomonadota bacterium]
MAHFATLQALAGFVFLIGLTFYFSEHKKAINWKLIISAFILQNILFLLIRYIPVVNTGLNYFSAGLVGLLDYAHEGAKFIFGDFVDSKKFGFVFLLVVVPTLVFFGSLIGILYFFGIIQRIIAILAYLLRKTVKLSGVESLVVISDIFLGQSEGPMIIGPYVKNMTRSELALAFTAGLANLSGSTLGMYLMFLSGGDHLETVKFANYLVTATFMNSVSAIIFAKILFPETNFDNVSSEKIEVNAHFQTNFLDSIVSGALTGLKIGAAMVAVLLAVISLVHLINGILHSIGNVVHLNDMIVGATNGVFKGLSLEYILGQVFRVFAFFMGINWAETLDVGSLLGQKVAINEFVAYVSLGEMKAQHVLSESSIFISTFALASFSNFSSIGISMGVFSVLAPTRQKELSSIAWKALFGAVMAGFMTATIAGLWYGILG